MRCWFGAILISLVWFVGASESPTYQDFDQPPHSYWQRPLKDPFTLLKADLESEKIQLNRSGEKAFLLSLLRALNVPESSQMLLFSTTSLQLSLIKPHNPRALFFTEDLYVGFIPGGRIEIVSLDPEVGGVFYIFDIPKGSSDLRVERSARCMNCHAAADTGYVPGLAVKSVVPGPNGGTLKSFRQERTGHDVPFEERFGGWYVTGAGGLTNHWGNLTGSMFQGKLTKYPLQPGTLYNTARYPRSGSDILPQLLLEHQVGFVNRTLEASYRARTALYAGHGKLTEELGKELDDQATRLTRYLLFADEARLPAPIQGDAGFKQDFLNTRRSGSNGSSLKDFDLQTRLFKYRCSYMIYSSVFRGLPDEMRQRVYGKLARALDVKKTDPDYNYLPVSEKLTLHAILKETLTDLPPAW